MFGNMFRSFDEDPFFRDFHSSHQEMMQDFFQPRGFGQSPFMPLTDGRSQGQDRHSRSRRRQQDDWAMSPFGGFGAFGMMDSMFRDMNQSFERMANDPNSHCYSSSSVMTFSNTGSGAPQYYEASSSTRQVPGGVKETRKTVRDSRTGTEKMAISHRIGDRAHTIEKKRDTRTGQLEEVQDFENLDETDAAMFDQEFRDRTSRAALGGHRKRHRPSAITDGRSYIHPRDDDNPPRPSGPSKGGRTRRRDSDDA